MFLVISIIISFFISLCIMLVLVFHCCSRRVTLVYMDLDDWEKHIEQCCYVGITINPNARRRAHQREFKANGHFTMCYTWVKNMYYWENMIIEKYNPRYNSIPSAAPSEPGYVYFFIREYGC